MDPVTLEVIKGAVRSTRQEMASLVQRTSMSESIREKLDYFVAMFNREGQMIYGTNLPLGANIIDFVVEEYPVETMKAGDLYWYNDCYGSRGGVSHSPDLVIIAPVYHGGELVAFSEAWGHLQDIGGLAPGSNSPFATEIYHEGTILPATRLERDGVRNDEMFRVFLRNSRFPETAKGDIRALIAAVRLGERRLIELCDRFGRDVVMEGFEGLIEQSEKTIKASLKNLPDGEFRFEDWVDGDVYQDRSYAVRLTLKKKGEDITFDFSETDDQARGTINFIMDEAVPKLMYGLFATADDPTALLNYGCIRALGKVITREGSLLNPRFPAPLGQRAAAWLRVNSCVLGAIGVANGGLAPASSPYFVIVSTRWQDSETKEFGFFFDGLAVGHGARHFADGHDGVYYVGQRDMPVEYTEIEFPMRIERYSLHMDSGGPGLYRGGCGIVRDYRALRDGMFARHTMDNVLYPPWGTSGGKAAGPGRFILNPGTESERELPSKGDNLELSEGDLLRVMTCGGGGWGNPLDRDVESVRYDVRCGTVSRGRAREDYGVVMREDDTVDLDATKRLRKDQAAFGKAAASR